MLVEIIMPKLGESITEGTIIEWRKKVGETIEKDEILLEIGTDKVDSEIPSPAAGIISEILAKPNDIVPVETVIAKVETGTGYSMPEKKTEVIQIDKKNGTEINGFSEKEKTQEPHIVSTPLSEPVIKIEEKRKFYTPLVRSIAHSEGLTESQLMSINGTGKRGRVTKKDVLNYIKKLKETPSVSPVVEKLSSELKEMEIPTEQPFILTEEITEMGRMRQIIATHMRKSLDTAAHVHLVSECDMTRIVKYVYVKQEDFIKREGYKLTYTPFFILSVIKTIKEFPVFNASLEGSMIIRNKNINIGLAVSLEKGLMVPVIKKCEELNFIDICRKIRKLTVRVRTGTVLPDELRDSTFSVSNYGVFGNLSGTPIINQPNVGILGIGVITKRPVVQETDRGDAIIIRSMCFLTLGFDHRLIDGAMGGKFLQRLIYHLENMDIQLIL